MQGPRCRRAGTRAPLVPPPAKLPPLYGLITHPTGGPLPPLHLHRLHERDNRTSRARAGAEVTTDPEHPRRLSARSRLHFQMQSRALLPLLLAAVAVGARLAAAAAAAATPDELALALRPAGCTAGNCAACSDYLVFVENLTSLFSPDPPVDPCGSDDLYTPGALQAVSGGGGDRCSPRAPSLMPAQLPPASRSAHSVRRQLPTPLALRMAMHDLLLRCSCCCCCTLPQLFIFTSAA